MMAAMLVFLASFVFALGAVVGSFLNVCIYRIPWQKSVIWPGSRCPSCLHAIAPRDNVPILGWVALGGKCRHCGLPISVRYPLIELLTGLLFLGVYLTDVAVPNARGWGVVPPADLLRMAYHLILVAALIVATFIDYDYTFIPDAVTVPGMVLGIALGAAFPGIRPEPATALTHLGGLGVGVGGLLAGGGLTFAFRLVFSAVFRREALGVGDITLLGMIGAFLGWQAAVLSFFLAGFFGLAHALVKVGRLIAKWLRRQKFSSADRELAFGPYLSMAATTLVLGWPWFWRGYFGTLFRTLYVVFWYVIGLES